MTASVRPIETARVQIRRTTVTIQALKIDNRQMTQSVFRQLPSIEWRKAVKLHPWGWINYWDGDWRAMDRPAVFESDGVLRRALIPPYEATADQRKSSNADWAHEDAIRAINEKYRGEASFEWSYLDRQLLLRWTNSYLWNDRESSEEFRNRRKERESVLRAEINVEAERLFADAQHQDRPLLDDLARTNALLDELGQLFIAT